jgi:hypothetical protein
MGAFINLLHQDDLSALQLILVGLFTLHYSDYLRLRPLLLTHVGLGLLCSSQSHEDGGVFLRFCLFLPTPPAEAEIFLALSRLAVLAGVSLQFRLSLLTHPNFSVERDPLLLELPWRVVLVLGRCGWLAGVCGTASGALSADIIAELAEAGAGDDLKGVRLDGFVGFVEGLHAELHFSPVLLPPLLPPLAPNIHFYFYN